jgi:hypothetical protein
LKVLFPKEYDLWMCDGKESYTCDSTYFEDADSIRNTRAVTIANTNDGSNQGFSTDMSTQKTWNPATSCNTDKNMITLTAPTTGLALKDTDIVTWTIKGVGNPEWGQSRPTSTLWDFDATDTDVWPVYDFWTSKF